MATHSSILAWRTPWTKEPGRLQSIESKQHEAQSKQHEAQPVYTQPLDRSCSECCPSGSGLRVTDSEGSPFRLQH